MIDRTKLPNFLTIDKLAEVLEVSRSTVFKRVRLGELPKGKKGAFGFGWSLDSLTDDQLKPKREYKVICDCGAIMWNLCTRKSGSTYYGCKVCGAKKAFSADKTAKTPRVKFPACSCGGQVLKTSSVKGRAWRYGRCRACGLNWKMNNETREVELSRGYAIPAEEKPKKEPKPRKVREPKPPKPPKVKVEKMAKTIGQSVKEKAKDIAERHARELVKGVVIPVDKAAAQKRKEIAEARERIEQRRIERELWDY